MWGPFHHPARFQSAKQMLASPEAETNRSSSRLQAGRGTAGAALPTLPAAHPPTARQAPEQGAPRRSLRSTQVTARTLPTAGGGRAQVDTARSPAPARAARACNTFHPPRSRRGQAGAAAALLRGGSLPRPHVLRPPVGPGPPQYLRTATAPGRRGG